MSDETLDWLEKSEDRQDQIMTAVTLEEKRLGRELTGAERRAIVFQYPPIKQPRGVAVG